MWSLFKKKRKINIKATVKQKAELCLLEVEGIPLLEEGCEVNIELGLSEKGEFFEQLMKIDGVKRVHLSENRLSFTRKDPSYDWKEMAQHLGGVLRSYLEKGPLPLPEKIIHRPGAELSSGGEHGGREKAQEERRNSSLGLKIQQVIKEKINPSVASHGGHISLVDVSENKVYLIMGGGCQGCGMAAQTLKQGVEKIILDEFPEMIEVVDVTDHSSGSNPYYS